MNRKVKAMRKTICMLLMLSMIWVSTETINASEYDDYLVGDVAYGTFTEGTQDSVQEDLPCPYTRYIMGATTHIIDKGDGKLYMGVEVYCTEVMKQIVTNFYLQQWIDGRWVEVCSHTSSRNDSDFMIAFVSVSYPPSGTYRVRTMTMVVDYYEFAEATEGNSGDIDFVSPYT